MKKYSFCFILSFLFVTNSIAQAPAVLFSGEYMLSNFGKVRPELIGYSTNSFFTYNSINGKINIQEFSKADLALKNELFMDLPGMISSERGVLKVINSRVNNVIYFITSELNRDDNVYRVYGFSINYYGVRSEVTLLEKMSVKKWEKHWKYGYAVSPNEKYFVLYHDMSDMEKASDLVEFKMFGLIGSELVKAATIKLPAEENTYSLLNIMVNDSAGFFLSITYHGRYVQQASYKLFAYSDKEDDIDEIGLFGRLFPFRVSFAIDRTNTIVCTGLFLDSKDITLIKGYFCTRINSITHNIISKSVKEIESKFHMEYFGDEGPGAYRVICDLPLKAVTIQSDSTIFVSSEVYHTGHETVGNIGRDVYFFGDILTAIISPDGVIQSINIISKPQIGYDSYRMLGFMVTCPGKEVGYVFLDSRKNYRGNERVKDWPMEKASLSVAVSARVNSTGLVHYEVLEAMDKQEWEKPDIQNGMSISDNNTEYLLFVQGTKGFMFIKLKY